MVQDAFGRHTLAAKRSVATGLFIPPGIFQVIQAAVGLHSHLLVFTILVPMLFPAALLALRAALGARCEAVHAAGRRVIVFINIKVPIIYPACMRSTPCGCRETNINFCPTPTCSGT